MMIAETLAAALEPHLRRRIVADGTVLFTAGAPVRDAFLLLRGQVRLWRPTSEGVPINIHTARPGSLIAEASLFSENYHCEARSLGEVEVASAPKPIVRSLLAKRPDLSFALMGHVARELIALRTRLELRNLRSAEERLWQYLQLTATDGRVALAGPLKDLAAELGLTPECLYRSLAVLQRKGVIERQPGMIQIMSEGRADGTS